MWQNSLQKRRLSEMDSCWKFPTLKCIRVIAFMDLIDAIFFAAYRAVLLTQVLAKIPPSSSKAERRESTGTTFNIGGVVSGGIRMNNSFTGGSYHQYNYNHNHHGTTGNESHTYVETTYMRYWSVMLLTGIVITFAVEVFLFLLLNSGAPMRNLRHCKHWFCLRVLLLVFSIAGTVIELTLGEYSLISALLELEKIYRMATLVVMWKFMDEVKAGHFDNRKLNCNIGVTDAGGSSNVYGSYSQAP